MSEIEQCPYFWTQDPTILFSDAIDFFPFSKKALECSTTALNSLTRFGIYFGLLLFIITQKKFYLGIPVLSSFLAVALYYSMLSHGSLRTGNFSNSLLDKPNILKFPLTFEGFANIEGSSAADKVVEDVIGINDRTSPTNKNPFMNILINEIAEYPDKPPAKYVNSTEVNNILEDQFQTNVYSDGTDIWNKKQGQREFYTMPSTSIPNDRESYQNWLYRIPGKTCKEGNNRACTSGTEGLQYVHLQNN